MACACVALLAFACGGAPPDDGRFRVALLTPGSIRDGGWNQGAFQGLQRIQSELGAEVAHQETRTPQEFEAGFRDFAARGFRLVFGHGFEFQDAAAKVAEEYPETIFITTSGSTVRANLAPMVFELEQATYVLGHAAARASRTGRLGCIGGVEIPSVASTFLAFEAGAKAARPDVVVTRSYIGNWEDILAAREAATALIEDAGADFLIHNADAAGRGVFQAAQRKSGTYVIGTNSNQNELARTVIVASATIDLEGALLAVAKQVRDGTFQARSIRFTLADGVIGIAWNEALLPGLPPGVRPEAEALVRRIVAGEVEVPRLDF